MEGVGHLPGSMLSRATARLRSRAHRRRLDAALAQEEDPWSCGELMMRAAGLGSLRGRRKVATALVQLVAFAQQHSAGSPYLRLRHTIVLEQRAVLLALASRLREPAPVDVAIVARLAMLVWDETSPAYVGGRPPQGVAEVTARCARALDGGAGGPA